MFYIAAVLLIVVAFLITKYRTKKSQSIPEPKSYGLIYTESIVEYANLKDAEKYRLSILRNGKKEKIEKTLSSSNAKDILNKIKCALLKEQTQYVEITENQCEAYSLRVPMQYLNEKNDGVIYISIKI